VTIEELTAAIDERLAEVDAIEGSDADLDRIEELQDELRSLIGELRDVDYLAFHAAAARYAPALGALGARMELHDDHGEDPTDPRQVL
jgi:hypothetical protein